MATLHIRNVPDELHERLRRHARKTNRTMSAIVLAAVERELEQAEWRERMANRPVVDLGPGETTAETLAEVREERDRQMDEWLAPRPGRALPVPEASARRRR